MLDTRAINDGNARRRAELFAEYDATVKSGFVMRSLEDYDELKRVNEARTRGSGAYVSPFLLSMKDVKIYDLDSCPVTVRKWSELENMRIYHQLFEEHKDDFG